MRPSGRAQLFAGLLAATSWLAGCAEPPPPPEPAERTRVEREAPEVSPPSGDAEMPLDRAITAMRDYVRGRATTVHVRELRAPCVNARGELVERCPGALWNGQPVYGRPTMTGTPLLSAEFERTLPDGAEVTGATLMAGIHSFQRVDAHEVLGVSEGPVCPTAHVLRAAAAHDFALRSLFSVSFDGGVDGAAGTWRLNRGEQRVSISDDC